MRAILEIAEHLEPSLVAPSGRAAFGGHAFRMSGSWHLARCGVHVASIVVLARWAGWVILRYIRDAPLDGLASEYRKGKRANAAANEHMHKKTVNEKDAIPTRPSIRSHRSSWRLRTMTRSLRILLTRSISWTLGRDTVRGE